MQRKPDLASVEWALWAACVAILPLPIWIVQFPPLQDFPLHMARTAIQAGYGRPGSAYAEHFQLASVPVPYSLADWVWRALGVFFPLPTAGKILVSLTLVGLAISLAYLRRSSMARSPAPLLLLLPLFFNSSLHMGYVPFLVALPLLYVTLGYWWAHHSPMRLGQMAALGALALLVYLAHLYGFLVLSVSLATLALLSPRRAHALLSAALAPAPALALAAWAHLRTGGPHCEAWLSWLGASHRLLRWDQWLLDSNQPTLALLFRRAVTLLESFLSFSPRWDLFVLICVLLLGLPLLWLGWTQRQGYPHWWVLLAVWALLFLISPDYVEGFFLAERLPVVTAFLLVPLLGWPESSRARQVWLIAAVTLYLAQLSTLSQRYREIDRKLQDCYALLSQPSPASRMAFLRDRRSQFEGWVVPVAFLDYYRYVAVADALLPAKDPVVGAFRPVRHRSEPASHSYCLCDNEEQLRHYLCGRWWLGTGGYLLVVGQLTKSLEQVTRQCGLALRVRVGPFSVLRKTQASYHSAPPPLYESVRFEGDEEYVVVYQSPALGTPQLEGYNLVSHRGWAWLFRKELPL